MIIRAGIYIKSTLVLAGTVFENSLLLISTHNSDGAVGFVINQPYHRALNELEEFKHSVPFPLYNGGPVDQQHIFFIHQRPDIITDGSLINNSLYFGGNFKQALTAINNKTLSAKDIKLFIGYCGWEADELEAEVAEGSWTIEEAANHNVFML
jgi:putative transcriptional regulator